MLDLFLKLLTDAKKVILLDAFVSKLSINFIKSLPDGNSIHVYQRHREVSDRCINILSSKQTWISGIITKINKGKKVFIYYPYIKGNKRDVSMQDLYNTIKYATGKDGKMYNSEIDDDLVKELDDVNVHWDNVDFIITNSKITVGVNFDKHGFNSVFVSIAGFSSPRDVIQASCRIRHLTSNNIYVVFLSSFNINEGFHPSSFLVNTCPIYMAMTDNIITEKIAPIRSSFLKLSQIAGYKVITNNTLLQKKLSKEIDDMLINNACSCSYDTINEINSKNADIIVTKIINHEATGKEKLELKKYFYDKQFIDLDNYLIGEAWDLNYHFFFQKIIEMYPNPFYISIFEKIKVLNKWNSILPENDDLSKVKLDNDLLHQIFDIDKWVFTRLTKKSNPKLIIRAMYNLNFGSNLITSVTDKSKNNKLSIAEISREIFDMSVTNLKAYKIQAEPQDDIFI